MPEQSENDFEQNLVSIVAHDLKTPIAAVRGFIELIQQVGPLSATQQRYAERALGGLQRMELLIANLLDMSRLEQELQLKPETFDLRAMIDDAVELIQGIADRRGIQIEIQVDAKAQHIVADPRWMGQVINNLLGNAVKYNKDNGNIKVKVVKDTAGIQVEVSDTGAGIASEDLGRVFQPFVRTRSGERVEGTGLGLAIVDSVVRRHGGQIWVTSTPGEGSTFSFTIPQKG